MNTSLVLPPFFETPPLQITDAPADKYHFMVGRAGFEPRLIVVHHSGGTKKSDLPWLTTASSPPVSCHRYIDRQGKNYKIVKDEDTAFTNGNAIYGAVDPDLRDPAGVPRNANEDSLSIELENLGNGQSYPLAQMRMLARQIVEWKGKYGDLGLVGHHWIDRNKNDPYAFDWRLLYRLIYEQLRVVLR